MAAISTLRGTLATALTNNGVWSIFSFPPETLLANSVVVTPSDPYIVPNNNSQTGIAPMANFKILMTKPAFDNQGSLIGIEDFIVTVFAKLAASSLVYNVSAVSAPSILNAASGDLLSCEISVNILTRWE